jgi:hypothetical protein
MIEELVSDDINQEIDAKKNKRYEFFKDISQGVILQNECKYNFKMK